MPNISTTMEAGASGSFNAAALAEDITQAAGGWINIPGAPCPYDLDCFAFPGSGLVTRLQFQRGAVLRPSTDMDGPFLSGYGADVTFSNVGGPDHYWLDGGGRAEILLQFGGNDYGQGAFRASNLNIRNGGREGYACSGTKGLYLLELALVEIWGFRSCNMKAGLRDGYYNQTPDGCESKPGQVRHAFLLKCDDVTITTLDLEQLENADDGDAIHIQDFREYGSQGTYIISGGYIRVDGNHRRAIKLQGGKGTISGVQIVKGSTFVAEPGTAVGAEGLHGIDLANGDDAEWTIDGVTMDCLPFKYGIARSVTGAANTITVKNSTLTGTTAYAGPNNTISAAVPTIGLWDVDNCSPAGKGRLIDGGNNCVTGFDSDICI
jgi:hypothetical protein